MGFEFHIFSSPPQSYSRELDDRVAAQEMPYGYSNPPPPYDHENREAIEAYNSQKYQFRPVRK